MRTRRALTGGLLALMLLLAGCQRLNEERTWTMESQTYQSIEVAAPRYEQKVTAHVTAKGAPVSAYLVREADKASAEQAINTNKAPPSVLAGKEDAEDITLEATVPAKTGYILYVKATRKKTEVQVKLTGR